MLALMAEREQTRTLSRAKVRKTFQKIAFYEGVNTVSTQIFCFLSKESVILRMGIVPNNLIQLQMMNRKVLFWPLAAVLLTACEKGLDEGIADVAPTGQVTNSVLQVRTRSGGSAGEESTVAYPIALYVFQGEL